MLMTTFLVAIYRGHNGVLVDHGAGDHALQKIADIIRQPRRHAVRIQRPESVNALERILNINLDLILRYIKGRRLDLSPGKGRRASFSFGFRSLNTILSCRLTFSISVLV